jgi:hypothetical protein
MLQRSTFCASLYPDRLVVNRPATWLDPSPLQQRGKRLPASRSLEDARNKLSISYAWAMAIWLAVTAAAAFLLLAHALQHGQVTLF